MNKSVKLPLEMFYRWEKEAADQVYLRQPQDLVWREYTWREVADQVRRIASFLNSNNYPPGSRIAIWSTNSKDWPLVDLAIMLSGHISVPIYPGQDISSARYIFDHSETRLVFAGAFDQAANLQDALPAGVATVAMLGCEVDCDNNLQDIVANFQPFVESPVPDPEDIFTLIYTSGTTGNPKGVMHMHQTPGHVAPGLAKTFRISEPNSRLFSFLPMSHVAERIAVEMCSLYANAPVSFSQGQTSFAEEMRSVQPTFFFAVPRLWVKFKEGVDAKIPPEAQAKLTTEQKQEIARQLGLGEAKFIATGSAPCPKDVQDWFLDKGIALRDGYGMTENCIHGYIWSKDDRPLAGCVGQPMDPTVQMRISASGEILFKSKGMMKGYYLNPEKTAEVFENGWYRSGDSGKIDEDGNLWVTGRVSEVFKTTKGKFIVPTRLEDLFGRSPDLAQFCVVGHGMDKPLLLASLSETGKTLSEDALKTRLQALLDEINEELATHEKIAQIYVTPEWTIENAMLTPTMKLKRKHIEETYREQIEHNLAGEKIVILQ